MIDTLPPTWGWGDEFAVMQRIPPECLDRYVNTSLRRHYDFKGRPLTPEWEATFLEVAARVRARKTWKGMAGRTTRDRVNV